MTLSPPPPKGIDWGNWLLRGYLPSPPGSGFTLLELLIVIVFLGVLSAISLPAVYYNIGKAKEVEALNTIGTINRAQDAYYFQFQRFAQGSTDAISLEMLGVVINSPYVDSVSIVANPDSATVVTTNNEWSADLTRAYSGGVFVDIDEKTRATICRSYDPQLQIPPPAAINDCGSNALIR